MDMQNDSCNNLISNTLAYVVFNLKIVFQLYIKAILFPNFINISTIIHKSPYKLNTNNYSTALIDLKINNEKNHIKFYNVNSDIQNKINICRIFFQKM